MFVFAYITCALVLTEAIRGHSKLNPGHLKGQQVLLTADPSLLFLRKLV